MLNCKNISKFLLVAFLIGAYGCSGFVDGMAGDFSAHAQTALSNNVNVVSFSSFTTFKWDKVFIFSPYTPASKIDSSLGYNWSNSAKNKIAATETEYLIIFVMNGRVVRYCEFPRNFGDFDLAVSGTSFSFGSDVFKIKQQINTNRLLYAPLHS